MAEKTTSTLLIEKEEKSFLRRLSKELERMADEGIEFTLPAVVIDHVANTERNLSFIRSKVKRHAREGVKEGDGLTLFKARKVRVQAEEEGRTIFRTELMIVVKCEISDAHHAIYRNLNQITETKLRIGVYTFDTRGCKYPDRTMSSLPIDVQQIFDRLQVNKSIRDPIYIDNKEDRVRTENQPHLLRTKGGYLVEKVVGIADIPVYNELNKAQHILSTPDRPSGPLLEEKDKKTSTTKFAEPTQMHLRTNRPQVSSIQAVSVVLSTPERSSEPSLEERNQNVSHLAASNIPRNIQVRNSNDDQVPRQPVLLSEGSNRRIIITDEFNQSSVFERLSTRRIELELSLRSSRL